MKPSWVGVAFVVARQVDRLFYRELFEVVIDAFDRCFGSENLTRIMRRQAAAQSYARTLISGFEVVANVQMASMLMVVAEGLATTRSTELEFRRVDLMRTVR
jgi:hypothetical protein